MRRKKHGPNIPTSYCPACGYKMDTSTHYSLMDAEPSAGDLSVCLGCGEILQFNDILVLQPTAPNIVSTLEPKLGHAVGFALLHGKNLPKTYANRH